MYPNPTLRALSAAALLSCCALGARAQSQDVLPDITRGNIAVRLLPVATGLSAPDYAISAPGDPSRLYVVEQNGLLRVIHNGSLQAGAVLDMRATVAPPLNPANANDERGFLGLAFHPGFSNPASAGFGTLYTYQSELIPANTAPTYAAPNGASQGYKNVVVEWKMGAGGVVDPASRREIISFGKNANNHNGGTIAFGPDHYLYLGLGDGGNARDVGPSHLEPGGNSQNLSTPLGKMLRFDPLAPALTAGSADAVSPNGQYRIPASNPFRAPGQVAETFAYGFRNPYRFAFDSVELGGHGDLILADVGQGTVEEIDRVTLGGNYGWAVKEGEFLFDRSTGRVTTRSPGDPSGLTDPIKGTLGTLQYDHGDGISITGGFVYRGNDVPELYGKYVFGDLALRNAPPRVDGRLFYADLVTGIINEFQLPDFSNGRLPNGLTVHGFGQDAEGELYALVTNTPANGTGGIVYRISAVPEPATWASLALGGLALWGRVRRRKLLPHATAP
jgi:glucose/arabinose dehydrogenase